MTRGSLFSHQDYTVGWICASSLELTAAIGMLDEEHPPLSQHSRDNNTFTLGRIGAHHVVMACLPAGQMGTNSAVAIATQLRYSFKAIRIGLLVGIGGGVPSKEHDIRLGDIVVSDPGENNSGVIQFDFGRTVAAGRFVYNSTFNVPPTVLLTAMSTLKAKHDMEDHRMGYWLSALDTPRLRSKYKYQGAEHDLLFEADYDHTGTEPNCDLCDRTRLILRPVRIHTEPEIHYGMIASGNQVVRHGGTRERWRRELDVLCFEMEAAGLTNDFPCLVIRGICDYADSHQNKRWQEYAAATAAAYAKELLYMIPGDQVTRTQTVATATSSPVIKREPLFTVPFAREKQFVGREDILSLMEQQLQIEHRVALCGLGGIGKSQIAIEYTYRYKAAHPQGHIFWVYSANVARFQQSYVNIAQKLKLPGVHDVEADVCELLREWLEEDGEEWLMILDNADDSDLFLKRTEVNLGGPADTGKNDMVDYLPAKLDSRRFVVITTRNRQLGEDLCHGKACIGISALSPEEATTLLQLKVGTMIHSWNACDSDDMLEALGRIPLAISQAAAYIRRNHVPLQRYRAMLDHDERNLTTSLNRGPHDHPREYEIPNAVFQTWKVSYDWIREKEPQAAALLSRMAMLDGHKIPQCMLRRPDEIEYEISTAIGVLAGLSLITKEVGSDNVSLHRLVQLSVLVWLEQANKRAVYEQEALMLVASLFPNGNHENWETFASLLPHAQAVLVYDADSAESKIGRARLLYHLSLVYRQQGRYHLAHRNASEAYRSIESLQGRDNTTTLLYLSLLTMVVRDRGKYEEAEAFNRRLLAGYEKVQGREHPDTLTSVNNLASVLRDQGKYEEAEICNRRALVGREKVLGWEHPDTLTSMNNLALVLEDQGKYEEAEICNRRALVGSEKVLGGEHPDTLTSVNNLASLLEDQGKYEEAEAFNRRALVGREKVLGGEHPDTLTSVNNLASLLGDQGKYEEAEAFNRRALAGREKVLGGEHPSTLTSVSNLASVLRDQGKCEEAEAFHRRALIEREKALGWEHPDTLTSVNNLASVLGDQGKYEEAEAFNRRALAGREKVLGVEHPSTLASVYCLAFLLESRERYGEATTLYRRAVAGYQKKLGLQHPTTLACTGHYSSMLDDLGSRSLR